MFAGLVLAGVLTNAPQAPGPDSAARAVLAAVIARREAAFARAARSRYDAFIKTAAVDLAAPPDSASSVLLLTETEISAYWESPDRFQETIDAHHRPSEGGLGRSPAVVEELEHFQRDIIVISDGSDPGSGGTRMPRMESGRQITSYPVPLPVAPDGLENYDALRLDTLSVDGKVVLRVTVGPRGHGPRFTGTVDVDSAFDVVRMDLRPTAVVRFAGVDSLRYETAYGDDPRWPREIRFSGHLERRISARWLPKSVAGMPMEAFPRSVRFEEVATLSGFQSDSALRAPDLLEYRRISNISTVHSDTTVWSDSGAVLLSPAEQAAWIDEDSEEFHPRLVPLVVRDANWVGDAAFGPGSFHYNRVDGLYLGVANQWHVSPRVQLTGKLGYGLGREQWQYRLGSRFVLWWPQQLWVGVSYYDETTGWPSLVPTPFDATASAFVNRVDPNEYFRNHGVTLSTGIRVLPYTRIEVRYTDAHQSTLDTLAGSGFRPTRLPPLPNPPIIDGHLRMVGGTLSFDSRQLTRTRLGEGWMSNGSWTRVSFMVDASARDVLASDFSFRRYSVQLEHQHRWAAAGVTTLTAVAGLATGFTPPQQYFTLGYGIQVLAAEGSAFNTLARGEFGGTRAAMFLMRHDFGRLFLASGLPVLRAIPATVSLHGGAFWTSLHSELPAPADTVLLTARHPYTEAGFTLGNLTPFLTPFDFAISCTWQLSSYPTHPFRFGIGFTGL